MATLDDISGPCFPSRVVDYLFNSSCRLCFLFLYSLLSMSIRTSSFMYGSYLNSCTFAGLEGIFFKTNSVNCSKSGSSASCRIRFSHLIAGMCKESV